MKSSALIDVSFQDTRVKISVFGNPLMSNDATPIKILPRLQSEFPHIHFTIEDPTESLDDKEDEWWMIDTVEGIDGVAIFEDIARFGIPNTVTMHDYDVALDLHLMHKLGKIRKVKIIGISPTLSENEAFIEVKRLLNSNGF